MPVFVGSMWASVGWLTKLCTILQYAVCGWSDRKVFVGDERHFVQHDTGGIWHPGMFDVLYMLIELGKEALYPAWLQIKW